MLPNELHHTGDCSRRKRKETTGGVCCTTRQNIKLCQGQIQICALLVWNIFETRNSSLWNIAHSVSLVPALDVCIPFTPGNECDAWRPLLVTQGFTGEWVLQQQELTTSMKWGKKKKWLFLITAQTSGWKTDMPEVSTHGLWKNFIFNFWFH